MVLKIKFRLLCVCVCEYRMVCRGIFIIAPSLLSCCSLTHLVDLPALKYEYPISNPIYIQAVLSYWICINCYTWECYPILYFRCGFFLCFWGGGVLSNCLAPIDIIFYFVWEFTWQKYNYICNYYFLAMVSIAQCVPTTLCAHQSATHSFLWTNEQPSQTISLNPFRRVANSSSGLLN